MTSAKLPKEVPLTEVSDYTDQISFDSLGAPMGFDQSQLLVNLRGFNRIRTASGLGRISITTKDGLIEDTQPVITGIDTQGTATAGLTAFSRRKPLASGAIRYERGVGGSFMRPDVSIVIDKSAVESRIEDKNGGNVFEVAQRAAQFNKAIRRGLYDVNWLANFGLGDCLFSSFIYGYSVMANGFPSPNQAYIGAIGNIIFTALNVNRHSYEPGGAEQALKRSRFSLFLGVAPDRYLVAGALLARAKLLKPVQAQ